MGSASLIRTVSTVAISAVLHAGAGVWLAWSLDGPRGASAGRSRPTVEVEVLRSGIAQAPPDDVLLEPRPGDPTPWVIGPADHMTRDPKSPWPRADVDTPDPVAAGKGGGDEGGSLTWTGRNDRRQDVWRAMAWNDPDEYRLGRRDTGDRRVSTESIARAPDPGIEASDRDDRRRARDGQMGAGANAAGAWDELDPRWDDGSLPGLGGDTVATGGGGSATRLAEDGGIVIRPGRAHVLRGDAATEAREDGPTEDDVDSAQASNERNPGAFEMTAPRAGGDEGGEGVAGPDEGDGNSRRSARRTSGQGGTRADVPEGHGQPATRARDQDPYLRKLNAKVLSRVRFPPKLAMDFEQGEVTVHFILRRDGSVSDVRVSRSSGFQEFDAALVDAIRDAAPFGPVPAALVGGRASVPVSTPFSFENPLIR